VEDAVRGVVPDLLVDIIEVGPVVLVAVIDLLLDPLILLIVHRPLHIVLDHVLQVLGLLLVRVHLLLGHLVADRGRVDLRDGGALGGVAERLSVVGVVV
jgi:hypothetical protein